MKYVTVEDCCDILDSQRIPVKSSDRNEGPYPYYGANGIQGYIDDFIFDDELVLLAEDGGNFGSKDKPIAYRISGKSWVNNHAHVLKPKKEIDVDYLCYALMFYPVGNLVNGATRQKLNQADMRKMKIALRSLDEQKTIVCKLKKINDTLELSRKTATMLDTLIKSRFVEMFGDPVTNPKGWIEKKLGSLGELNRGISKHRPRNAPELLGGEYPLIQTGDVANADTYITKYQATYSELGLKQSRMWDKGTLCITIAANIAKTGILTFDACFPDSVVGFVANKEVDTLYVHHWFAFFQKILEAQAPQSAQKNINLKILNELEVIVPPIELQNEFANFVQQVEATKQSVTQSIETLQTLKASLMQKYFH